jgi:purine catabolism regulator
VLAIATTANDADRRLTAAWRRHRLVLGPEEFGGGWVVLVNPAVAVARLHAEGSAACGGELLLGVGPVAEQLDDVAAAAQAARGALIAGRRIHPDAAVFDHTEMGPFAAVAERPEQLRAFVDRALGPLLRPPRPELLTTLEVVLTTRGAAEAAARLGVHRHTIVYRLGRITELLTRDLDDPEERHRLWLAMRLRRLL